MSSKNNVNPDYYKQGGRNRPDETTPHGNRPLSERDQQTRDRWEERQKDKKNAETEEKNAETDEKNAETEE